MGGSAAKALKKYTAHEVVGFDVDDAVTAQALADGAIDYVGEEALLSRLDVLVVALYPADTVDFVQRLGGALRPDCLIVDFCGVKGYVCQALGPWCAAHGRRFVGGHPMAGREFSGYAYTTPDLFRGASMILTPTEATDETALAAAQTFFAPLGFRQVVVTTPDNHDRMIAFTSQLAHVVSNAYIKSPEAALHTGYSAGSYKDLTRVAKLNAVMWSELFLDNREALLAELDTLLAHLTEYRQALSDGDRETLRALLQDGSDRKEALG